VTHLDRIAADPAIVHRKPAIRGTRITVQVILELVAAGETFGEGLAELRHEDMLAALE
jgi:uncharacterized protein (DUF433 family)